MKFKVGDRVKDEAFGEGTVVETNTGSEKRSVLVKFDKEDWRLHNGNSCCLKGPYEENHCWFYGEYNQEELKLIKNYTYEDLKKSPIGTKVTFENGEVLVKDDDGNYDNAKHWREELDLKELEDKIMKLGKIIKIEEPTYQTIYEVKQEILDEAEKRYLKGVIRPFKDKVKYIEKCKSVTYKDDSYICIYMENNTSIALPYFESKTMYKNMENDKEYTLEELGL